MRLPAQSRRSRIQHLGAALLGLLWALLIAAAFPAGAQDRIENGDLAGRWASERDKTRGWLAISSTGNDGFQLEEIAGTWTGVRLPAEKGAAMTAALEALVKVEG